MSTSLVKIYMKAWWTKSFSATPIIFFQNFDIINIVLYNKIKTYRQRRENMDYCSTRDNSIRAASAEAIAAGISKEGGLFVPCEFPRITYQELCEMETDDYKTRAQKILSRF